MRKSLGAYFFFSYSTMFIFRFHVGTSSSRNGKQRRERLIFSLRHTNKGEEEKKQSRTKSTEYFSIAAE